MYTGHQDNNITITICDNSIGIPNENLSKIFDPFFTTKPVGSGADLGLSLPYSIIKQYSRTITVESNLEKMSTFSIVLLIKNDAK